MKEAASLIRETVPESLQRAMDLAEKGASSWFTSLPIEEFGFSLHKGAFRDTLVLRCGWFPLNVPVHCACGTSFTVQHALSCPKGGFPTQRHNKVQDLIANLMAVMMYAQSHTSNPSPARPFLVLLLSLMTVPSWMSHAASEFWGGRCHRIF